MCSVQDTIDVPPCGTRHVTAPDTAQVRRRGRPYRLPVDPTAPHEVLPSVDHRLAWLLGVSRLHATEPGLALRVEFMRRLEGLGVVVDAARMSRWESGKVTVAPAVLASYEQALALPQGQLCNVATMLGAAAPRRNTTSSDTATLHQVLDGYFEEVFDRGADGRTWESLAELLTSFPHLYLLPDTWTQVTERLASELTRSVRCGYLQRMAALRILVRHPRSREYAVRAIGHAVTNDAAAFVLHPLSLLGEVDDPRVARLLFKTLGGQAGHDRGGATWAAAGRVLRGNAAPGEVNHLAGRAIEIARNGDHLLKQLDALTIFAALPASAQLPFFRAGLDPETRGLFDNVRVHGDLYPPEVTAATTAEIAATAQEATPISYVVEKDQMLHRLVREALFHAGHDRRQQAALLLAASPYRAALVPPLLDLAARSDETGGVLAMIALHHLVGPDDRAALLDVAVEDRRPIVRIAALSALTQVVGRLSDDESARLCRSMRDREPFSGTSRAMVHVLGIGQSSLLPDMVAAGGPQAAGARWWLDNPPVVDGCP